MALGILPSRPKFTEPMDWQDLIIYIKIKWASCFLHLRLNLSSVVKHLDVVQVLLEHEVAFHLHGGTQFAARNGEVLSEDDPLLDLLSVGDGLLVGAVKTLLKTEYNFLSNTNDPGKLEGAQ